MTPVSLATGDRREDPQRDELTAVRRLILWQVSAQHAQEATGGLATVRAELIGIGPFGLSPGMTCMV